MKSRNWGRKEQETCNSCICRGCLTECMVTNCHTEENAPEKKCFKVIHECDKRSILKSKIKKEKGIRVKRTKKIKERIRE